MFSSIRFLKSGYIHPKSVISSVIGSLAGSYIGSKLVLLIDDIYLKYFIIIFLPIIAIFIITRKKFGEDDFSSMHTIKKIVILSYVIGLLIGTYDGFIGPGTGTFLMLAYTGLIGFDIKISTGNTKLVNLASNIASLFVFIANGKVLFAIGIPAAIAGILGNWIGSGLVIMNGLKIIRPIFAIVIILLMAKIIFDVI